MCKVLKNLLPGPRQEMAFQKATTTSRREHRLKFKNELSRLDLQRAVFSRKVVNTMNKVTVYVVVYSPSVDVFKWRLD